MLDVETKRQQEIVQIEEGNHQQTISMQMIPKNCDYGFLDDEWDADGDSIIVRTTSRFLYDGSASVVAEFARGTSPKIVSRVLRKFADMLDESDGYQLANLDDYDAEYSDARRMPDGKVLLSNFRKEYEEYLREGEDGDLEEP